MRYVNLQISDRAAQNFDQFCAAHRVPNADGTGTVKMVQGQALSLILEHVDTIELGRD